jgi:C4-type Zn-finger protein
MKCPQCGTDMKIMNLPSEAHYGAVKLKKLNVCIKCGYEKEVVGGDKLR